jgi:RNA polymerase sigma-70 factor (ECF subfamily)
MRAPRDMVSRHDRSYRLDDHLMERLYRQGRADRWSLPMARFAEALAVSLDRAFPSASPTPREIDRYLAALHLEDLALACACAAGSEPAWDHFVTEHRPLLYRSADALESGGGAREIADSLYADLYGLQDHEGERRSLFRYFHGRSSLATWLRSVLAQRYVDSLRSRRRLEPLPEEESSEALRAPLTPDPDRSRFVALIRRALGIAVARLPPRDRLRLGLYYAQELTLAEAGRILGEHEATVSRQLARTRNLIRRAVEQTLRGDAGLNADEVARCFESVLEDAGPLDLKKMLASEGERKMLQSDRSK